MHLEKLQKPKKSKKKSQNKKLTYTGREGILSFCFIASTGRTGSTFLQRILTRYNPVAAAFHGNLVNERLPMNAASAKEALSSYFSTLLAEKPEHCAYIECNPGFIESWAGGYSIGIHGLGSLLRSFSFPVKCLWVVRNPQDFVLSLKAVDWRWKWASLPGFEELYGISLSEWKNADDFEQKCLSWVIKNRLFRHLSKEIETKQIFFRDLFGKDVTNDIFLEQIQNIHRFLELPLVARIDDLIKQRRQKANVHNTGERELSSEELVTLRRICGEEARRYGYEI